MSIKPGSRIGSYDITSTLGEGGMGVVFRARDAALQRDVAAVDRHAEVCPAFVVKSPANA